MTRIVRGLDLVPLPRKMINSGRAATAPANEGEAEQVISRLLASRLALPPEDVRVHLEADRRRTAAIASEAELYADEGRSEEHTSELQSLMRISYAVFCLKKKKRNTKHQHHPPP